MVWWIWLLVAGYVLLAGFVIWQMGYWTKKARSGGRLGKLKWVIPFISIFSTFPILGTFLPENRVAAFFQEYGNIWIGILAATGIVMLFALISRIFVRPVTTKYANGVMIATLAFALIVNGYGAIHAQNIKVHYYQVTISEDGTTAVKVKKKNSAKPEGNVTRIAFISDLHLGVNTNLRHTQRMVDAINAEDVDIVLGGGDYFTSTYVGLEDSEICAAVLSGIESNYGGYYAYGNHDVTERLFCGFAITSPDKAIRYKEMDQFFESAGWNIVQDDVVEIDGIQFYLRKDAEKTGDGINKRASVSELMTKLDTSKPVVVVEHEPDELLELADAGVDLVLSGHTHNGQIFPGNIYGKIDARKNNSNSYGKKNFGKLLSIVSSGVGYYGPPIRIGTDSEVMIIDIIR